MTITPQKEDIKCPHNNHPQHCLVCYNDIRNIQEDFKLPLIPHATSDKWKKRFDTKFEWSAMHGGTSYNDEIKQFIESLLLSEREALKQQAIACAPSKQIPYQEGGSVESMTDWEEGFNDCREQTLSALHDL